MAMPRLDLSSGTKRCPDCSETLPLERFSRSKGTIHGYSVICKECSYQRHKAWLKKNPGYSARKHREERKLPQNKERYLDYSLKRNHGLGPGTYTKMLTAQEGKCGICQRMNSGVKGKDRFHVDHCHDTGVIRGLLCHNCNVGIGNLKHDEKIMLAAVQYLRRFPISQT